MLTPAPKAFLPFARGQPSRDRRVPRQSPHHRGLSGRRLRGRIVGRATSATCPRRPPTCPPRSRASRGPDSGVDVDNDFKPLYVVSPGKKDVVRDLKRALKDADEVLLATDEDREGEAIAWHLLEVLKPAGAGAADGVPRDHPRGDPAGHRRAPRHRPAPGRRPGGPPHPRPPLRLRGVAGAVEEDQHRACRPGGCRAWPPASWSSASGRAWRSTPPATGTSRARSRPRGPSTPSTPPSCTVDGARVAIGQGLRRDGRGHGPTTCWCSTRPAPPPSPDELGGASFAVRSVESKPYTRKPAPPFMTSTLAAGGGPQAALLVVADHGDRPAPLRERPHHLHAHRQHHAVRGRPERRPQPDPREVRPGLPARRAPPLRPEGQERPGGPRGHPARGRLVPHPRAAAQPARQRQLPPLRAHLGAHRRLADDRRPRRDRAGPPGCDVVRRAATPSSRPRVAPSRSPASCGPTWRAATTPTATSATGTSILPPLTEGGRLTAERLEPKGHETQPPARFTEASLVRRLEELGVGSAVHLRRHHQHDHRPRVRVEEGHRPRPLVHRLRRGRPCSRRTSPTWSTTPSPPAWRTTSTTSPAARPRPSRG